MKNKESNEIKNLRSKVKKTLRVTSSSLESILYKPFKVLDSGFIRVIDYMGDDSAIVQSARVSYGEGTKNKPGFPKQPDWFLDARGFKNLNTGLKKVGFNENEVNGILGNNWYNFYKGIN